MNSTQAQQSSIRNVTMTIIFDGAALNRDEKIGGSILSIKKMKVNGEVRSFISKPAIRHYLFETLRKSAASWKPAPVKLGGEGDKKVVQFDIQQADIFTHEELDAFGYMYTVGGEGAYTRKAPVGITKAVSLQSYEADIAFYANHDLVQRGRNQGDDVNPNPYSKEEHSSLYKLSVTVDASILGRDNWLVSGGPVFDNNRLRFSIGEIEKSIECHSIDGEYEVDGRGRISVQAIQNNVHRVSFVLAPQLRITRFRAILESIRNGLYSQSSGEANTIVPLFLIASAVTVPSPVFHSFIDVRVEDGRLNVIGIKDAVNNGWVDGNVFVHQSERLSGRIDPTISEHITNDWDAFLRYVGVLDQQ